MAKLGEGLKFKYEPIWPQAPTDMRFHYYEELEDGTQVLRIHEENFKLVSSIEELKSYVEVFKDKTIGFDTETTGLTYGEDKIVGFSLSADRWSGIYVPIRHRERLEVTTEVPKLDKNGNKKVNKAGKVAVKKEITVTFQESDANLDPKQALDVLYEILINAKLVLAHNSEFDLNVLKFEGYNVNKIKSFDTLILPYVYDPEATGLAGLKALEKRVLGRTVPEFKEVLGKKYENFGMVPPKDGYVYACCDTSGVVGIYEEMYPKVRQLLKKFKNPLVINGVPYDVISRDNVMVKIFVDYYGHAKIPIDRERAIKYKKQLEERQRAVIKEIYEYFDKGMFNLSPSSNEFKAVMASKQVFTGVKTEKDGDSWSKKAQDEMKRNLMKLKECITNWKSYNFTNGKLSKDGAGFTLATILELYGKPYFKMKTTINNITFKSLKGEPMDLKMFWLTVKNMYLNEKKKLYILNRIQENNSLCKALNSYVDKLTQVDECVMHYRLKGTKSGRLSSGNGSKSEKSRNHYYIDLNAQNLTKPASAYYVAEECPMTNEESILGWKFTPVDKDYAMEHLEDLYIVEGQDPNITVRSCLKAPKGRYVVSLDYDAQEYRLIAILSQDSKMLENFFNGIDPHTASAYAIWGEENYDKGKRKKAKIFNFLNNYSGGAYTLAQQLDIAPTEAQEMINKYNKTFHEMVEWKEQQIGLMYQNEGVVFNAFGRPRQFKGWIDLINKNSENYDTLVEKQNLEAASNRVKSAIERRVPSHLIQGTAGDILRLVMINLYIKYFRHRDPHIDFLSTVHDEVNYTIDKEVTTQYVKDLEELMTFDLLDPRLPIATSTDIGFTYGNMFPFVWKDESKTILIPKRVHHA